MLTMFRHAHTDDQDKNGMPPATLHWAEAHKASANAKPDQTFYVDHFTILLSSPITQFNIIVFHQQQILTITIINVM